MYGTGASNVLEYNIVNAKGEILTVNNKDNRDLFWALKGGGGGSWGVVLSTTYITRDMPTNAGGISGTFMGNNKDMTMKIYNKFFETFKKYLHNEHYGEQVTFVSNGISVNMHFVGKTLAEVKADWNEFKTFTETSGVTISQPLSFWEFGQDENGYVKFVPYGDALYDQYLRWWGESNVGEVSAWWINYVSRYVPVSGLDDIQELSETIYNSASIFPFSIHFNKGQSGASDEALQLLSKKNFCTS
eukprot:UN25279